MASTDSDQRHSADLVSNLYNYIQAADSVRIGDEESPDVLRFLTLQNNYRIVVSLIPKSSGKSLDHISVTKEFMYKSNQGTVASPLSNKETANTIAVVLCKGK